MASTESDFLWRMRWFLLASCLAITGAVAVLIATVSTHWRWSLLTWGVLIGLVGYAILELVVAALLRTTQVGANERAAWKRRRVIYAGLWLFFGTLTGVLSAAFGLAWIDVVVAAYAALSLAAGCVLIALARRRRAQHPHAG